MSQYQRILLIADPSLYRTPAYERAAWLAKTTGAALHIALFDHSAAIVAIGLVDRKAAQSARETWQAQRCAWLAETAAVLRARGIHVTTDVVWAHPVLDEMLEQIGEYRPDLIIKDAQQDLALRRLLLNPLDWNLVRDCAPPVLLVGADDAVAPRRVLVAVDLSDGLVEEDDFNHRVVRAAMALAIQCNAGLDLACAFDFFDSFAPMSDCSNLVYEQAMQRQQADFKRLASNLQVPDDCAHFLNGQPHKALADFARRHNTGVMVLGTHQRRAFERLLTGSTAETIVHHSPCDVMIVKPEREGLTPDRPVTGSAHDYRRE